MAKANQLKKRVIGMPYYQKLPHFGRPKSRDVDSLIMGLGKCLYNLASECGLKGAYRSPVQQR